MDIEKIGSIFVFSMVKIGFGKTFIESYPIGWYEQEA